MKDKKICVYTCITGDYDNLQELQTVEKIDYYCFTNNKNIKSNTWKVIYIEDSKLSNIQLARKIKILGHPLVNEYDIAVWIDGAIRFDKPIIQFIKEYFKDGDVFSAFKHSSRNNIKEECYECIRMRKEEKNKIKRILSFYEKEHYDFNNGLIESGVFIKRPKNEKVIETMNLWFHMILNYSHRDQLSFNYCISRTKMPVHWIKLNIFNNKWLVHQVHTPKDVLEDCRIYYGDSSLEADSYDFQADYVHKYKVNKSIYSINTIIKKDTKVIEIELSNVYCIFYSDFKLDLKCKNVYFFNTIKYHGSNVFYNNKGIVRLEGDFKKGDKLSFSIKFKYFTKIEKLEFINHLCNKVIILTEDYQLIEKENRRLEELSEELATVKGSIWYKFFLKDLRIRKKLKKVFFNKDE